jgi:hypothetical protein
MIDDSCACIDEHSNRLGLVKDDAMRHRLLDGDIALNVQGLEVWLGVGAQ